MNRIALPSYLFLILVSVAPAASVVVRTDAQLTAALGAAKPGDEIRLAPGTYRGGEDRRRSDP